MFFIYFLWLFWAHVTLGNVLHVPSEYNTIQSALDSVVEGDTVLVEVGLYTEALHGPPFSFNLIGNIHADSINYPKPIIDPSVLPRSDTLTCLTLMGGDQNQIKEFVFRNRRAMYIPQRSHAGGILNYTGGLTLVNCDFDSTYGGVVWGTPIELRNCTFRNINYTCIQPYSGGRVTAINCYFSGQGYSLLTAGSNSHFSGCHIRDNQNGHLLIASGNDIVLENCIIGPYGPYIFTPISFTPGRGCIVRSNLFTDIHLGPAILTISMNCPNPNPLPIIITNNTFRNYNGGYGVGGKAIEFICQSGNDGYFGRVEDNIFENSQSYMTDANAILIWGSVDVYHNRFSGLTPAAVPDVYTWRGGIDSVIFRDNFFERNGYDLRMNNANTDARWNWWGDSTGPYHPSQNPDGLGGQVRGNALITPWYTDTSFFNLSSDDPFIPHPSAFILSSYPNPFNPTTTISFSLSQTARVKLTVYDITGREVQQLLNEQKTAGVYHQEFDGTHLPSGIYFARLETSDFSRIQKVVLLK